MSAEALVYSARALSIAAQLGWAQTMDNPLRVAGQLVRAALQALPVTGVGLALLKDGTPSSFLAATDDRARLLGQLQVDLSEGPCQCSMAAGRPVLVDDFTRFGRAWPAYTSAAVEAGVAAEFAIPLGVGDVTVGILDLYRDTAGPLPAAALSEALAFGTVGTWVLLQLSTNLTAYLQDWEMADRELSDEEADAAGGSGRDCRQDLASDLTYETSGVGRSTLW